MHHAARPTAVMSAQSYVRPTMSLHPSSFPHSSVVAAPPSDSRVIFSMGFDPALVTRALRCSHPFPPFPKQCRHPLNSFLAPPAEPLATMRTVQLKCCFPALYLLNAWFPRLDLHPVRFLSSCLLGRPKCHLAHLSELAPPHNRLRMLLSRLCIRG